MGGGRGQGFIARVGSAPGVLRVRGDRERLLRAPSSQPPILIGSDHHHSTLINNSNLYFVFVGSLILFFLLLNFIFSLFLFYVVLCSMLFLMEQVSWREGEVVSLVSNLKKLI